MFLRTAALELHLDFPSAFKPRTLAGIETHTTDPGHVSSGSAVLWIGRLRAVISSRKQVTEGT